MFWWYYKKNKKPTVLTSSRVHTAILTVLILDEWLTVGKKRPIRGLRYVMSHRFVLHCDSNLTHLYCRVQSLNRNAIRPVNIWSYCFIFNGSNAIQQLPYLANYNKVERLLNKAQKCITNKVSVVHTGYQSTETLVDPY